MKPKGRAPGRLLDHWAGRAGAWTWAWAAAAAPAALLVATAWPAAAPDLAAAAAPPAGVPGWQPRPVVQPPVARADRATAEPVPPPPCASAEAAEPRAVQAAWQQLQQALAGGSAAQQTLALLLQWAAETEPAGRAELARQAVDLALRSQDATAQRWAAAACSDWPDGGACQRSLLLARLAAEPDNALHWAAALDLAGDDADQVWAGLAQARQWRGDADSADPANPADGAFSAAALAKPLLDARLPAAVRVAVLQRLADAAPTASALGVSTLAQSCVHYGPGHAWGQACRHVAGLMLAQSQAAPVLRLGLAWAPDEALSPAQRAEVAARIDRWEAANSPAPVCARPRG